MCKNSELLGSAVMACGAGILLALLFGSDFAQALVGVALLAVGLCVTRRCC